MTDERPTARRELSFRVITFYSYKGGVGRSMALASVAALLADSGVRVLAVDFDLEAPGLHRYFDQSETLLDPARPIKGLVEMFDSYRNGKELDWHDSLMKVWTKPFTISLDLLPAGGGSSDYVAALQSLNWDNLFAEHNFGDYLCRLREQWRQEYDVVLIDSRTGMSDVGGICTIILPDAVVMLFTANVQSIEGTADVIRRARAAQQTLPVERGRLLAIPMLSRDDRRTEYEQSERWRYRIASTMSEFFAEWVLKDVPPASVLQILYLPQIAYWSFGERLPVIERPDELHDPSSLGAAYGRLAKLIGSDFDWGVMGDPVMTGKPDIEAWEAKLQEVLQRESRSRRISFIISLAAAAIGAGVAASLTGGNLLEAIRSMLGS